MEVDKTWRCVSFSQKHLIESEQIRTFKNKALTLAVWTHAVSTHTLVWCAYALGMHKDSANTGLTSITLTVRGSQKACLRESQLILELISFMCCKIYWTIKHWTHLYFPICSFWSHSTAFFWLRPNLIYCILITYEQIISLSSLLPPWVKMLDHIMWNLSLCKRMHCFTKSHVLNCVYIMYLATELLSILIIHGKRVSLVEQHALLLSYIIMVSEFSVCQ